jgi:hypothetical protein
MFLGIMTTSSQCIAVAWAATPVIFIIQLKQIIKSTMLNKLLVNVFFLNETLIWWFG